MRVGETLKAAGLALLILALNLLVTTAAISVVLSARGAGHGQVDQAQVLRIAAWSAPIGGGGLFLAAISWLGRRRPERNPWTFALRAWIAYVIIDGASGAAAGPLSSVFNLQMALSMTVALAGALAGAAIARSPRTAAAA